MPVGTGTELDDVQDGRRAGDRLELALVPGRRDGEVLVLDRHRVKRSRKRAIGSGRLSRMCVRFRSGWPGGATRSSTWRR